MTAKIVRSCQKCENLSKCELYRMAKKDLSRSCSCYVPVKMKAVEQVVKEAENTYMFSIETVLKIANACLRWDDSFDFEKFRRELKKEGDR